MGYITSGSTAAGLNQAFHHASPSSLGDSTRISDVLVDLKASHQPSQQTELLFSRERLPKFHQERKQAFICLIVK